MVKLSILIPTTPDRYKLLTRLRVQFIKQLTLVSDEIHLLDVNIHSEHYTFDNHQVEIIYYEDNKYYSIGYKRNILLRISNGEYVAFIDSDDRISDNYFKLLFDGIEKDVDCCSLTGEITEDGVNPKKFIHSIRYYSWFEEDNIYYRYPNHLSCIKSSIAKRFKFPEINTGEDHDWSTQIYNSKLIKTEHWIEDTLYYYDYRSRK